MSHLEIIRPRQVTRWQRFTDSLRSIHLGPWNAKDVALARAFGGAPVSSGVSVNERTAMNYSAVWSAVNLIASDIGKVPLRLYKRVGGGKERFDSHALHRLIHDRPNPHMGSMVFRRTLQAHALIWLSGYAEIERDQAGRPVNLWPLLPMMVEPFFDGSGALKYRVHNPTQPPTILDASDVVHIRGLNDDGIGGPSLVQQARESIGLGIAIERFGAAFFGNGATFGGIISYPLGTTTNPQVRDENRKTLESRHQGVDRSHRLLAVYEGAKYEQMGVPPNHAQFLETRQFQIEEVCRWFNLPPHKLKHLARSTNNNIEHQGIEYVTDTLDPWWVIWEQELNMKLISPLERGIQVIEHVREGLLRGDQASRSELQSKQFSVAMLTPNEGRAMENRNPITNGEKAFVALNLIPLDLAEEYWRTQIDSTKAKAEADRRPPPAPSKEKDAEAEEELKAATKRAQEAEDARDLACSLADAAKAELQRERAARASDALAHEEELEQLRAQRQSAMEERASANVKAVEAQERFAAEHASAERFIAERDAALAEAFEWRERQQATEAQRVAERAAEHAVAAAELKIRAQAEADRDAALTLATQAEQERDEARATATTATAAHAAAMEAFRAAEVERDTQHAAVVSELSATLAAAEAERDAARALVAQAEVDRDTGRAALGQLRADLDSERDRRVAAQEAITHVWEPRAAALEADAQALGSELARARADLATELDRQKAQRGVMLAAMRGLFAEATDRLLTKEANAARKHQATPEKLRAWVENFYAIHGDTVRAVFRPLVGPWTAVAGGVPGDLLDHLVRTHLAESERALQHVLMAEDEDQRAEALERTFKRWHEERGDAMADALLREGMGANG